MTDNAFCAVQRPTVWRRLGFGGRGLLPAAEHPDFAPSELIVVTTCSFDWKDRLRLLISGRIQVEARGQTDVAIKRSLGRSAVGVLPPLSAE